MLDEGVGVDGLGGLLDLGLGEVGVVESDVVLNGAGEEEGVLEDVAEAAA